MSISAATIDRLLSPLRRVYGKKGLATTESGSLLKKAYSCEDQSVERTKAWFFRDRQGPPIVARLWQRCLSLPSTAGIFIPGGRRNALFRAKAKKGF
ncbi:MAG TPA: hypothetical protein EYP36_08160 [Calditrichaeota bacterium]|nr:hypothetical protein [Calditrichota bacterium]